MIRLMNSAMMPQPGTYQLERITVEEFANALVNNRYHFLSYIGYADTARFITDLTGVPVRVSREQTVLNDGEIMLICRLKYRVPDPHDKGRFTPGPDDYEFFICKYYDV